MTDAPLLVRLAVSEKLRAVRQEIAEAVTEEFFKRHPDWLVRYGERGKKLGIEDACYHLDFLAGAVETGSAAPFADYVHWVVNMLGARGIAASFLAENLTQIEGALRERLNTTEQAVALPVLEAGLSASGKPPLSPADTERQSGVKTALSVFLQAILLGEGQAALNIAFETMKTGTAPADIYVDVLQAALYEVGALWENGRISVSVEHTATAITQNVLSQMYSQIKAPPAVIGKAVIAVVPGELHQIGANMVADMLDAHGWDTRFLGGGMPHEGVLQAVADHDADVLGISATMLFSVPQVIRLIRSVRETSRDRRPRIIVGGSAFRSVPNLWREIGADGAAVDLRGAVLVFRENLDVVSGTLDSMGKP